jgi:hypothetical protein
MICVQFSLLSVYYKNIRFGITDRNLNSSGAFVHVRALKLTSAEAMSGKEEDDFGTASAEIEWLQSEQRRRERYDLGDDENHEEKEDLHDTSELRQDDPSMRVSGDFNGDDSFGMATADIQEYLREKGIAEGIDEKADPDDDEPEHKAGEQVEERQLPKQESSATTSATATGKSGVAGAEHPTVTSGLQSSGIKSVPAKDTPLQGAGTAGTGLEGSPSAAGESTSASQITASLPKTDGAPQAGDRAPALTPLPSGRKGTAADTAAPAAATSTAPAGPKPTTAGSGSARTDPSGNSSVSSSEQVTGAGSATDEEKTAVPPGTEKPAASARSGPSGRRPSAGGKEALADVAAPTAGVSSELDTSTQRTRDTSRNAATEQSAAAGPNVSKTESAPTAATGDHQGTSVTKTDKEPQRQEAAPKKETAKDAKPTTAAAEQRKPSANKDKPVPQAKSAPAEVKTSRFRKNREAAEVSGNVGGELVTGPMPKEELAVKLQSTWRGK